MATSGSTRIAAGDYVTLVEVLEMTRPFDEFETAIKLATHRLEREGVQELFSVQFYCRPESSEAGALLTFADRNRMVEHINRISQWDEFKQFFGMVRPVDVRVYGKLNIEAEAWVRQFGVLSKMFEQHVAGFVRETVGTSPMHAG